jgi:hypothetical protein
MSLSDAQALRPLRAGGFAPQFNFIIPKPSKVLQGIDNRAF